MLVKEPKKLLNSVAQNTVNNVHVILARALYLPGNSIAGQIYGEHPARKRSTGATYFSTLLVVDADLSWLCALAHGCR